MRALSNQQLGKKGEDLAGAYLTRLGYRIIARNFRKGYGELDIVAIDRDTLVFVEVKTRIGRSYGSPEEAVTPRKLREVIQTAQYFQLIHPGLPDAQRIDVIAYELDEAGHLVHELHLKSVTS